MSPDVMSSPDSRIPPNEAALAAAIEAVAPEEVKFPPVEPLSTSSTPGSAISQWLSHPFGVTWRAALVKAPRLVPLKVLRITAPEGPFPFKYDFKSPRGNHSIPLYIWIPPEATKPAPPGATASPSWPVIIDFHGGGFVLGSCLEQAPFCAQMCRELGAVVMSVDYRMGPIDKFPSAVWDGEDVLRAVLDADSEAGKNLREAITKNIDSDRAKRRRERKERKELEKQKRPPGPLRSATVSTLNFPPVEERSILDASRLALSGFSSGGNLALNLGLHIQPPDLPSPWPSVFPRNYPSKIPLLLFYPSFDSRLLPSQRVRPANLPASSPFWSEVDDILAPSYLPRDQASHPRASPGLADVKSSLHKKAKVFLVLPELDSLSHQSEVWVKKVEEAERHGDLEVCRVPGMKHGWTQFPVTWLGDDEKMAREKVFKRTVEFVKENWSAEN